MHLLSQVLTRLAAVGHRVLLFCTMTRVLDALEDYCAWRGWEWERLDGTTGGQERADAIARFNNPGGKTLCCCYLRS
jgi:SNF2 family DNA or RNA helicase